LLGSFLLNFGRSFLLAAFSSRKNDFFISLSFNETSLNSKEFKNDAKKDIGIQLDIM
jgi:hypothetical protein